VDHWLINPLFDKCAEVDFSSEGGELEGWPRVSMPCWPRIRKKHKEYGIKEKPFVVVKADNSDPRMGI
jgi:glutamate--cysteine ligase